MNLEYKKEIPLINDDDEEMTATHIIPYQKICMDLRDTAYQYEFLNDKDKTYINFMLLTMHDIKNAFVNLNDDPEMLKEGQSIYDFIFEWLQISIGEQVTEFIGDMDEEELKKNIIEVKGEDWYKEHIGELNG